MAVTFGYNYLAADRQGSMHRMRFGGDMDFTRFTLGLIALAFCHCAGAQNGPSTQSTADIHQAAMRAPFDAPSFERYLERLGTFRLPNGIRLYAVEGDLLLTRDEVRAHLIGLQKVVDDKSTAPGELISNLIDGKRDFWEKPAQRKLTYVVVRSTFGTDEEYQLVVQNMKQAGRAWEQACAGCKITFAEVSEADAASKKPVFQVKKIFSGGLFAASAFFPSTPNFRRNLLIDPTYFTSKADKVGILRHELGHILGYRHEQLHGVSGCDTKGDNGPWLPLTAYDPKSVMHYFCGDAGTLDLKLTQQDIEGHRKQYEGIATVAGVGSAPSVAGAGASEPMNELVIRIEGGMAAKNLALAAVSLQAQGLLGSTMYEVKAGDSVCSILKESLAFPGRLLCPKVEFQRLLESLNGKQTSQLSTRLSPGQLLRVPTKLPIETYSYSRVYYGWDEAAQARLPTDAKLWNVKDISGSKESQKQVITFEGYELRMAISDTGNFPDLERQLASPNVYLNMIPADPKSAEFYSSSSPDDRLTQCRGSEKSPAEGHYLAMLRNPMAAAVELPACALTCQDAACAQIHFIDTPVFPNQDIRSAIRNLPAGNAVNDAAGGDQRLCTEIAFKVNEHHATHLSGIMVSQKNGFGFVGLSPGAQLYTYEREKLSDPKLANLIEEVMVSTDRPQRKIFLFASLFAPYPSGVVDAGSGFLKDADSRFTKNQAAKRIRDNAPLWISAAGQPSETSLAKVPVELMLKTPMSPMNLGDLPNVVVVTSCEDCSDKGALLDKDANYSGGHKLVHLAAPGRKLAGWATTTQMAEPKGGTSQAAAFVAGLAASMINCHGQHYPDATSLRQRLMLTSRSVFGEQDLGKLRTGIVDADAALLDPSKHWLKKYGDAQYSEVKPANWCVPAVVLSDTSTKDEIDDPYFDLRKVRGIARYARDDDNETRRWIFTAQQTFKDTRRSLPGTWSPSTKLLKLENGTTLPLNDIEHLLLAKAVVAGDCK